MNKKNITFETPQTSAKSNPRQMALQLNAKFGLNLALLITLSPTVKRGGAGTVHGEMEYTNYQ